MDEARHGAVDSPQLAALRLPHHQLHRLGVALVELLHLGEHVDAGSEGVLLHLELDVLFPRLLGALFAPVQPQGVAADDVLQAVPVLLGLVQGSPRPVPLGQGAAELILACGELLPHRLVPVHNLLGGGGQGGQQGLGLGRGGGLHRLLLPQGLHLALQSARGGGGLLGLGPALGQPAVQRLRVRQNGLQPRPLLLDLRPDAAGAALLLVQLPPHPVGVLQVVLDVGF